MNKLVSILLGATALLSVESVPAHATITIDVFDNNILVGSDTSLLGVARVNITGDPFFDVIDVSASGNPFIPGADLSSVALSVTSANITSLHQLNIEVFQTGVIGKGPLESTFTVNNLVGLPGPTTESTFINGTNSTLGSPLATHTFPFGTISDSIGPIINSASSVTADAHQYLVNFTTPDQSANDTIQLTAGIPEPATWVMLIAGFLGLALGAITRKKVREFY